jgi:acyl-CoA reductase-like NAD-dependent aldehyde dehydrogenase
VLSGADPEHAAHAILWGGTANAGQSCLSIERVYVDRSLYDDFVRRLVTAAQQVSLAWPTPADGQIGPIIAADQIEVIERHLTDAINKGARALCGGSIEWLDGGAYVRPTVLVDVDHTMLVMREETFGPLLPVMAVDGREEAIRLANDSDYGLSAAVFGGTAADALEVAARLDAGAVSVNDAALTALVHDGEKNSFNSSGLGGSRMGPAALTRFLRKQAFIVNREGRRDPWWHNGGDAKDLRPDP